MANLTHRQGLYHAKDAQKWNKKSELTELTSWLKKKHQTVDPLSHWGDVMKTLQNNVLLILNTILF